MISISDRRAGFALPAVLTVTGVVTLIFVVAITALASLTAEAAAARSRIRFLERALNLEAQVSYLAVTEPFTQRSIAIGSPRNYDDQFSTAPVGGSASTEQMGEILLDGEAYLADVGGPITISLRDQAGMINLPQLGEAQWRNLGQRLGVSGSEASSLWARFADYADTNDLASTGGGERSAYRTGGPANRPLLRPSEWLSVLGVRSSVPSASWRALRPEIAADQMQGTYNVNTASAPALQVLFNLTPSQAQRAIEGRRTAPFASLSSLGSATGSPLIDDGETFYTFPSGRIVFTLSDGRSPWVYRGRLTITPTDPERPAWVDQTDIMESPRRTVADATNATPFPYAAR